MGVMKPPFYIALEGPDGAGKTTQMTLLRQALTAAGVGFVAMREPGTTGHGDKLDATTEALLFSADRRHTVVSVVRPALARGDWVLSDRTYLTTLVFQGYGGGLSLEMLNALTDVAVEDTRPDVQVVLDLPVEESLGRKDPLFQQGLTESRFENKGAEYHQRNRDGYKAEVAKNPDRYVLVDARGSPAEVHARIIEALNARLQVGLVAIESGEPSSK